MIDKQKTIVLIYFDRMIKNNDKFYFLIILYINTNSGSVTTDYSIYKITAEKGEKDSMYYYGLMLFTDKKSENKIQVFQYIKLVAEAGLPEAIYFYGNELINGEFHPGCKNEGIRYMKLTADVNSKVANQIHEMTQKKQI